MSSAATEIPNRASFKAVEVCEIARVQPYVLRSWEAEFPSLGLSKTAGGPRVYRRVDIELVLRLKQLLFVDGLTLGGARRKLEAEYASAEENGVEPAVEELVSESVRSRLAEVKQGLRTILRILSGNGNSAAGGRARKSAEKAMHGSSSRAARKSSARHGDAARRGQKATVRRSRG